MKLIDLTESKNAGELVIFKKMLAEYNLYKNSKILKHSNKSVSGKASTVSSLHGKWYRLTLLRRKSLTSAMTLQ